MSRDELRRQLLEAGVGLMLNAIVLWNTRWIDLAVRQQPGGRFGSGRLV